MHGVSSGANRGRWVTSHAVLRSCISTKLWLAGRVWQLVSLILVTDFLDTPGGKPWRHEGLHGCIGCKKQWLHFKCLLSEIHPHLDPFGMSGFWESPKFERFPPVNTLMTACPIFKASPLWDAHDALETKFFPKTWRIVTTRNSCEVLTLEKSHRVMHCLLNFVFQGADKKSVRWLVC